MKDAAPDETVIDRLNAALEADALPKAARAHARHLLNRLSSPVRVTVLGLPGSGKSELLNMFVGRRIFAPDLRHPAVELGYGAAERTILTDADGLKTELPGIDLTGAARARAAFVRLEMPLERLKRVSFLEIVTDGTVEEMRSAIDWAVRRTDIALWCTQGFGEAEQVLWRRVPDSLKDHAFMVLTKADILSAQSRLSSRIASLEQIVAEEFHSLYAVATLQALKSIRPDGSVDEALHHASGGGALTAEILRHAERGRRADIDSAQLFLARYQVDTIATPAPAKRARPAPAAEAVAPDAAPAPTAPARTAATQPAQRIVHGAAEAVENPEIFEQASRYLRKRGDTLAQHANADAPPTSDIVSLCGETVDYLIDLFASDDLGCPAAEAFIDDLTEAQELMVLMRAEHGAAPGADAVTLLLQLRRDIDEKLAA